MLLFLSSFPLLKKLKGDFLFLDLFPLLLSSKNKKKNMIQVCGYKSTDEIPAQQWREDNLHGYSLSDR